MCHTYKIILLAVFSLIKFFFYFLFNLHILKLALPPQANTQSPVIAYSPMEYITK